MAKRERCGSCLTASYPTGVDTGSVFYDQAHNAQARIGVGVHGQVVTGEPQQWQNANDAVRAQLMLLVEFAQQILDPSQIVFKFNVLRKISIEF